jgi:hypothetical protein
MLWHRIVVVLENIRIEYDDEEEDEDDGRGGASRSDAMRVAVGFNPRKRRTHHTSSSSRSDD